MATLNATTSFSSFDCSFLPLREDATVVPTSPHSSSDDADHIFPDDMMSFLGGADMALCGGNGHVSSAAGAATSAASAFLTSFKQEGNNELFDLLDDIEGGSGEEDYGQFTGLLHGAATPLVVETADSRSSAPLLLFPSPRVSARTLAECPSPTPSSSSASAHQRHTFMAGASHSSSSSSSKSHTVATADPGRNARMAKENRERKKKYVAELESKISTLQKDKDAAQAQNVSLQADLTKAQQEIASLRAMLQNSSALAQVISALGSSGAISFGANIVSGNNKAQKRGPNDNSEDEQQQQQQLAGQPPQKRASTRRRGADEAAGVVTAPTAAAAATAAPTTILPIQLNIHVHSNAL